MTAQIQNHDQQHYRRHKQKRLVFSSVAVFLITGGAVAWKLGADNIINILGAVFTVLGVVLALLQWEPRPAPDTKVPASTTTEKQNQQNYYGQIEGITLNVKKHECALIVYTPKELRHSTVNLSYGFNNGSSRADLASSIIGHNRKSQRVYLAYFPSLKPGNYTIHDDLQQHITRVTIDPDQVREIDWR